jgi:hypothetical protein
MSLYLTMGSHGLSGWSLQVRCGKHLNKDVVDKSWTWTNWFQYVLLQVVSSQALDCVR